MTKAATAEKHFPFPGEDGNAALAPVAVVAPPQSVTPMDLLQVAISKGVDMGQLEKLMDLHERWQAMEARKAFVAAMNAFKADPPEIIKNHKVSFGEGTRTTAYDHATLDNVCKQVTKGLSKHGISHRWRIEQSEGLIRVTCILTHELGHSEETTLAGGADTSGSKNSIQAIGSTVTYLERYTLLAATGLAAKNADNDGQGAPLEWMEKALKAIKEAPDTSALAHIFKESANKALLAKNGQAIVTLTAARDERKAALAKDEPA